MPSHYHRHQSDSQPEPYDYDETDHTPRTPNDPFGFEELDFTDMEQAMVMVCHPQAEDYVLKIIETLSKSEVYKRVQGVVSKKCRDDKDLEMKMMFALAMLTGASTMLTAVDEGYVDGDEEDEGEGGSNETD